MLTFPNAKINIGLYVTERRPDGYHNLETVFYPIPLQDVLETKPLKGLDAPYVLQVVGAENIGPSDKNLVVRVYRSLAEEFHLPALDIYLHKRIPTGAGLGGGSSDAAYMMKMLNEEYELGLTDKAMEQRLADFGADCPFFVREEPTLATGIGNIFSPINISLKGLTLLLVKPDTFVSTREAYSGIAPKQPEINLREALANPISTWRHTVSNDFERSVFATHPHLAAIKQTLYDMGAIYAAMSGSGSTLFGLFPHPVEEAGRVFADCFVFQERLHR